jgi:hypothetical protein
MTPTLETVRTEIPDLPRSAPWRLLRDLLIARHCALHDRNTAFRGGNMGRAADAIVNVNETERLLMAGFGLRP